MGSKALADASQLRASPCSQAQPRRESRERYRLEGEAGCKSSGPVDVLVADVKGATRLHAEAAERLEEDTGIGLLSAPASAEASTTPKRSATPSLARWAKRLMSQFATQASSRPAPRSASSASSAPSVSRKTTGVDEAVDEVARLESRAQVIQEDADALHPERLKALAVAALQRPRTVIGGLSAEGCSDVFERALDATVDQRGLQARRWVLERHERPEGVDGDGVDLASGDRDEGSGHGLEPFRDVGTGTDDELGGNDDHAAVRDGGQVLHARVPVSVSRVTPLSDVAR